MDNKPQFEWLQKSLLVRAPAKLNLSLLIAGKRPDGFHEIETVMAKIDFFDEIKIASNDSPGIHLTCTGSQWAPEGSNNLVYQAADHIFKLCGMPPRVQINLNKQIPAGTGLGSASSDAAATLLGLNRFFCLGLNIETLADIAAQIGSDVTFFLHGPQSFCKGKGEIISTLSSFFDFKAFIIIPYLTVSTKRVYKTYRHNPDIYHRLHRQIKDHLDKNRFDFVAESCTNMLSSACFSLNRGLAELKERIESLGIGPLCLSGSGTALYCIADKEMCLHVDKMKQQLLEEIKCNSMFVNSLNW